MKKYKSIKELVIDIHNRNGLSDCAAVTKEVKERFPDSKFDKSHCDWYKSQIKTGKIKTHKQIKQFKNGQIDPKVKKIGDEILNHINFVMDISSGDDANLRFKLNRWVYSRLLQSEIKAKRPIKKKLWESGMNTCQAPKCNKIFKSLKNVEIHRKNQQKIYSIENCILVCRECHEKLGKNV